jgi:hypothetical protein
MRRLLLAVLALLLAAGAAVTVAPSASAGACPGGQVEVRGRIRDIATGLPLDEVTSVGITDVATDISDGFGTNPDTSRFSVCLEPGDYTFQFDADSYRREWYHNQTTEASATEVEVALPGPVIVNEWLIPRGLTLAGRITNASGRPVSASIGIYRQRPSGAWVGIDGIGNRAADGIWSYQVPGPGRYRVNAAVDSHWARWHRDATRLRFARVLVLDADHLFVRNVDIAVPFCHPAPDFCIPPGFNS